MKMYTLTDDDLNDLHTMMQVNFTGHGNYPNGSIMDYGTVCEHDEGCLCEHRSNFIIDWIKTKK